MKAASAPGFKNYGAPVDGTWAQTDPHGESLPHDDLYPPTSLQPQGTRYAVDMEEQYVEWSKELPINFVSRSEANHRGQWVLAFT